MGRDRLSLGALGAERLACGRRRHCGKPAGRPPRRGRAVALALGLLLGLPLLQPAAAQSRIDTRTDMFAGPAPSAPRAGGTDPRDRPFRAGGFTATPSFGTTPSPAPAPRVVELAPRPNLSLEAPRAPLAEEVAGIRPTIINPSIPAMGMAAEGMVNRRERRFLDTPAAGARFSAPVTW